MYVNLWSTGIVGQWIISENNLPVNKCWRNDLCHAQSSSPNQLAKTIVCYQEICEVVEKLVLMTPT
jgi:hypothetical protein